MDYGQTHRLALVSPGWRDVWCMYTAWRTPGFDRGLRLKGPLSFLSCLRVVFRMDANVRVVAVRRGWRSVGAVRLARDNESWMMGYWVHPNFQGHGYAAEAVSGVLSWAANSAIDVIVADCHVWNVASRKVLERCGFTLRHTDSEKHYYQVILPAPRSRVK